MLSEVRWCLWSAVNRPLFPLIDKFQMPYLHWEKKTDYKTMRKLVKMREKHVSNAQTDTLGASQKRFALILGEDKIHIRRSLDQSYYWSLRKLGRRDNEQVVDRYR